MNEMMTAPELAAYWLAVGTSMMVQELGLELSYWARHTAIWARFRRPQ